MSKATTLTPQQKTFADHVLSGKSYHDSALLAYNIGKEGSKDIANSADSSAQEALKRPLVQKYIRDHLSLHTLEAQTILATLMRDDDPRIQLTASVAVLQRIDRLAELELRTKEQGKGNEELIVTTTKYTCPHECKTCRDLNDKKDAQRIRSNKLNIQQQ